MKNILVIEADRKNADLIHKILSYRGYEVSHARFGATSIDMAREQQPDLIIIALRLPDTDGKVVARFFKNLDRTRHIPIIGITADSDKETTQLALDYGCDIVVRIPIDTRVFADYVAGCLMDVSAN